MTRALKGKYNYLVGDSWWDIMTRHCGALRARALRSLAIALGPGSGVRERRGIGIIGALSIVLLMAAQRLWHSRTAVRAAAAVIVQAARALSAIPEAKATSCPNRKFLVSIRCEESG